jgi:thiol:disulfide interchange protein
MSNKIILFGCLAACLLAGCKVDETKRGTGSTAASNMAAPPVKTPATTTRATPRPPAAAAETWNDEGIAWRPLDAGLAEAKQSGKPVMLVVYTDWCPHCRNYSKIFSDQKIAQAAKKFVMIRVNQGTNREEGQRFAPDGQYIPRTMFLTSDGELIKDIKARKDKYQYFYQENNSAQVLSAMARVAK